LEDIGVDARIMLDWILKE